MKRLECLPSIRRLCRLLWIQGAGQIEVSRSQTISPREFYLGSFSSVDSTPHISLSDFWKEISGRKVIDKALSSYSTSLPPSNPFWSSTSSLFRGSPPAASLLLSPSQSPSGSDHLFRNSFWVFETSFATIRERVQNEEQIGGFEKPDAEEPWRKILRETREGGCNKPEGDESSRQKPRKIHEKDVPFERQFIQDADPITVVQNKNVQVDNSRNLGDKSRDVAGWNELGWTSEEVFNWPNAISMARLLSGPLLAWMILHGLWGPAFVGLVIAGTSDWLDGYVARKMHINSVLGSYLDPVADKFLVGSLAVSMAYAGLLHPVLVSLIIARDGVLMGGAFLYRAYSLGWQWNNWREFFRISIGGAGQVQPLFISKVNTVFQLALVGVALLQPALSMEDTYSLVPILSWLVVVTTSMSWGAYAYIYLKNPENLVALRRVARGPGHETSQRSASAPLK